MKLEKILALGLLATSTTVWTGCATKPDTAQGPVAALPTASNAPLGDDKYASLIEQFNSDPDEFEKQVMGVDDTSLASMFRKASDAVSEAISIKPKVVPAGDPVQLSSGIPELGPEVYFHAGQLAEKHNKDDEALRQYERALDADPSYQPALLAKGRLHDRNGRFVEAVRFYHQAIAAAPKSPVAHNDLGLCLARMDKLNEAASELRRATLMEPKEARYRNNLATVLVKQGQTTAAMNELEAVYESHIAHYNMAYLLHSNGHGEQAVQHLQQAVAIKPEFKVASVLLGKLTTRLDGASGLPSTTPAAVAQPTPARSAGPVASAITVPAANAVSTSRTEANSALASHRLRRTPAVTASASDQPAESQTDAANPVEQVDHQGQQAGPSASATAKPLGGMQMPARFSGNGAPATATTSDVAPDPSGASAAVVHPPRLLPPVN